MKSFKFYLAAGGGALAVVLGLVAVFVPLGSYTTYKSVCPDAKPNIVRLDAVKGDSLDAVKAGDVDLPPNAGCAAPTKYVLYAL